MTTILLKCNGYINYEMIIFASVCRFRGECVVSDRQGHHQRHCEAHLCWDTLLDGPRGHGAGRSEYKIRIILMYHLLNYYYETSKISPPPKKKVIPILECYIFNLLEKNIKKFILIKQFLFIDLIYIRLH